jgi:chemotaxis protein MotB
MARVKKRKDLSQGWLMTFTDMLMLLVVMFVLFLSFSEIDSDSFKQNAGAISEAFNQAPTTSVLPGYSAITDLSRNNINIERIGEKAGIETNEKNEKEAIDFAERKYKEKNLKEKKAFIKDYQKSKLQETLDFFKKDGFVHSNENSNAKNIRNIKNNLSLQLKNDIEKGKIEIIDRNQQVILRFPEKVTFPSGSAELNENIKLVITRVRNIVKGSPELKRIVVTGHTDNVPISNDFFSSNWELSAARAVAVVHSLLDTAQIDKNLVLAVGSADTQPVFPNSDAKNRAANRRVEIKLEF